MTPRKVKTTQTTSGATINYGLPLWEGQDVTSWLTTMNDAMNTIDTAMNENKVAAEAVTDTASTAESIAQEAADNIATIKAQSDEATEKVATIETVVSETNSQVNQLTKGVNSNKTEIDSLMSLTDSMQDDISTVSGNLETLTETVNTDVTNLTQTVQENSANIVKAAEAVEALNTQVQDIEENQLKSESFRDVEQIDSGGNSYQFILNIEKLSTPTPYFIGSATVDITYYMPGNTTASHSFNIDGFSFNRTETYISTDRISDTSSITVKCLCTSSRVTITVTTVGSLMDRHYITVPMSGRCN